MGDASASRARWHVQRFAEIDSTNQWVLDQARGGADTGLVAVADHQTAGRGRRGRAWTAPPGSSLLVSVLLRPALDAGRVHVVTMAAGLALLDAVEAVAGVRASLKWPNDLVVGDRKLAGLLAEADVAANGEVRAVVVGAGCNVEWHEFPPELAEIATACNLEAGRSVDRAAVLDVFLDRLAVRLDALDTVVDDYRSRLATLGRRVSVDLGDRTIVGVADDVDASGRLVLTGPHGERVVVAAGDVVHLRLADA
jgi:BirA family transcriptional regulator, biotin operon repressor / biotin---[acetyl-CoA-carboxylase] ligase